MIQLYTIGFTGKTAQHFFELLQGAGVRKLVDTRRNNVSQLAGFAKGRDLRYFAQAIGGIGYEHDQELAPTADMLSAYRKGRMDWQQYADAYLNLLDLRRVARRLEPESLHGHCLLCSEHGPEHCHRRLLAEYLHQVKGPFEIVHLM